MRFHPYRCESAYPDCNAERNLAGRTHYADPETRKYFKSRIVDAGHYGGGLLFWLIESMPMKHPDDKRGFRYRIFDLCGNVVAGKSIDDPDCFHRTRKAACRAMLDALKGIDPIEASRTALDAYERSVLDSIEAARRWIDEREAKVAMSMEPAAGE